jgi:hypothetical protein
MREEQRWSNRVGKSIRSIKINKVLDIVYIIIVYKLYILFWLVLLFKKLSLYSREIKEV